MAAAEETAALLVPVVAPAGDEVSVTVDAPSAGAGRSVTEMSSAVRCQLIRTMATTAATASAAAAAVAGRIIAAVCNSDRFLLRLRLMSIVPFLP
ncbi:hypothetical protein ABZ570_29460 [Micromonospora sp. NPDC007271]|uniref:hypothetical protein n=1 Tax=Micromonospora sp. NPDC007271 TaxID=3154587 RepID=UPI0033EE38D8